MKNKKIQGFTTRMLTTPYAKPDPHHALHMPVYHTVAFDFETSEDIAAAFQDRKPAHAYTRTSNPTVEYLERKIISAGEGRAAIGVASGMAAISNVMLALLRPGENILSSRHLFGHTYGFFNKTLPDLGIETRFCNLLDMADVRKHIDGQTRLIFFETVTNPQLEVVDIERLMEIARKHKLLVIADSTLTPMNVFSARKYRIDIEVMSSTKFISGGGTSVGGIIVDTGINDWQDLEVLGHWREKKGEMAFIAKVRKEIYRHFGSSMSPEAAHMQCMGLDILTLRVERAYTNCMKLAQYLQDRPEVRQVDYPGMPGSPFYELSRKQFNGIPGTILSFDLSSMETCFSFMDKLNVIRRATNLNDNKSLIIHPWSTIYAEYPEPLRSEMHIRDNMLRLSVGIEEVEDLMADIEQAMN